MQLGAFELGESLGRGGMARVWKARQRHTGVSAAVKVVDDALSRRARHAFEGEVRAHASLSHPGIIYLFDYGFVSEEEAATSNDVLRAGTPYLAMELAEAGTLRDHPLRDWSAIRVILTSVLDTLAHAHARNVIHRDLKPENLLICDDESGRHVKLADFGIAHALGAEHEMSTVELSSFSGTPHYMPPEQIQGKWRAYGPWTDLYAVGCIAWELVCRSPLFEGDSSVEVVMQHLRAGRPPLDPKIAVPPDLERWLRVMLARDPADRFRRAADALDALPAAAESEPEGDDTAPSPDWTVHHAATLPLDADASTRIATTIELAPTRRDRDVTGAEEGGEPRGAVPSFSLPACPETWRAAEPEPLPLRWVGTGLSLFGLREIPFIDRDDARDVIWEALLDVVREEEMRVILLCGGPGTGKSSLAEWVATRADEVGAARPVKAVHSASGGNRMHGLPGAARRAFRTIGLSRAELHEHLRSHLSRDDASEYRSEYLARAFTEWLQPAPDAPGACDGPRHQFSGVKERLLLALRIFQHLSEERPSLFWLDDLHWGIDTLTVLEFVLATPERTPQSLVIATVRSDLVAEDPALASRFEALGKHPACRRIDVEPLEDVHHRQLIRRMLHLDDALLERISRRTEGNPLFATQLLRDLIDQDALTVGDEGFRLVSGVREEVPDDIYELWTERIDRLVATFPDEERDDARVAIELAAALGRRVADDEWEAACSEARVTPPGDLVGRMARRGLVDEFDGGWGFAHGLLVDSLERQSKRGGRRRAHHRACARMLEQLGEGLESTPERRAYHWLEAGEPEEAIDPLYDAADFFSHRDDYDRAIALFDQYEDVLEAIDAPRCDRRRVRGWLAKARTCLACGESERANILTSRAGDCLENLDDPLLRAELRVRESQQLFLAGNARDSIPPMREALELFREEGSDRVAACLRHLAFRRYRLGEWDASAALFEEAADAATTDLDTAHGRRGLGMVLGDQGQTAEARVHLDAARLNYEENNHTAGLAHVHVHLGEMARAEGRLDAAERHYREALRGFDEVGTVDVTIARINIAIVLLEGDLHEDAAEELALALRDAKAHNYRPAAFISHVGLLVTAAARADWDEWEEHLRAVEMFRSDIDVVDVDVARMFTWGGLVARDAEETSRARQMFELALDQWERLGRDDDVQEVQELLDGLPSTGATGG